MWLLTRLYIFSRILRHTLLLSVFGKVSECKHSPSCGRYFIEVYRMQGVFAAIKLGIPRIITCY